LAKKPMIIYEDVNEDAQICVQFSGRKDKNKVGDITDLAKCSQRNLKEGSTGWIIPLAAYATIKEIGTDDSIQEIDPIEGLINGRSVLYNIENEIKTTETHLPTRHKALKEMLLQIVPQLHSIEVKVIDGDVRVVYYEKSETGEPYSDTPQKLRDLGDGMRGIIKMIGDMVIRLQKDNPPNTALNDLHGIVLIDEVDANLHSKYQFELPHLLSKVFPKVQFIAITHSPIPLLGAPKKSVILTVNRTPKDGITAQRMDDKIEVDKLNPSALLSSDIFGYKFLFARDATPDTILPYDNYEEVKEMTELEQLILLKNGLNKGNIKL